MASEQPLILVFDTETTGLGTGGERSVTEASNLDNWPIIVQLAFILYNPVTMEIVAQSQEGNDIIKLKDNQYPIPQGSVDVHGVTDERSRTEGRPIEVAMDEFVAAYNRTSALVAHNTPYDVNVVCAELLRLIADPEISEGKKEMYRDTFRKLRGLDPDAAPAEVDTQYLAKAQCRVLPYKYARNADGSVILDQVVAEDGKTYDVKRKEYYAKSYSPKNPNLEEAHIALFGQQINGRTHSALVDVAACLRVFMATEPEYHVDICAPENRTPSNVELCRIINPGRPFAHKIPKIMPLAKGKKGGRRTRRNKHKKTQRKNKRRSFTKKY
jgi:DNA polymerase III epsilon subunit-like protein